MKDLKELVINISEGESAAHSYIIEGKSGSARDSFLMKLLSGLECLEDEVMKRPCGSCAACMQTEALSHPDIVYMQKSGKRGYRTEDAAAFMERLCMRPYGRFLIGVIDDAELLNETVQNKLLKTLEEPAQDVIIILLTSRSDELLGTVRSRCSLIRMDEYSGFASAEDEKASEELKEGVALMLPKTGDFCGFREFIEKNIKTAEDAVEYIGLVEEELRTLMGSGASDIGICASGIEEAEKTAMDIGRGMDKSKALKRLFLELGERSYK